MVIVGDDDENVKVDLVSNVKKYVIQNTGG